MDGSMRLTRHPGSCSNPRFSRDRRWIAYYRVLEGQRDIWIVDSNGGSPHQITDNPAADVHPDWSPDDRRVAFCSDRSGSMQLWIVEVAEGRAQGTPHQLTSLEGTVERPAWSPAGKDLAFILHTNEGSDVWIVAADGSGSPRRATAGAGADFLRWTHGEGGLLVAGYWGERQAQIRSVSPVSGETSAVEDLVVTDIDAELWGFDVAADGRTVVLSVFSHRGDVWELEADSGTF
jgi:Tol biopolymer transport system component